MKFRKMLFIAIVVMSVLIASYSTVEAVPQLPSSFFGTVKVNGANVPDGTVISAWINGVQYASMLSETYETDSVFYLDVPGDDPSTTGITEGGVSGDTIIFKIDGLEAIQTASWHTGTNVNLDLSQELVTVTADPKTKIYGNPDPGFTFTYSPDDPEIEFTGGLGRDSGENVGPHAINIGTLAASGYAIEFVPDNLTITAKPITITADAKSVTYGNVDPALTFQPSVPLIGSDTFTGSLARVSGQNIGTYPILQGTIAINDGNGGANYSLTYVGANLTINTRPITITADDKEKLYDNPPNPDPVLTYQITSGSLAYSDSITGDLVRVAGEDLGTYPINQGTLAISDGNSGNNYSLTFTPGTFTITDEAKTCYALTLSYTGWGAVLIADPPNSEGCELGTYEEGASISLTATPDEDWHVDSWMGSANDGSKGEDNLVIMPASPAEVTVNYRVYTFVPILTGGK